MDYLSLKTGVERIKNISIGFKKFLYTTDIVGFGCAVCRYTLEGISDNPDQLG